MTIDVKVILDKYTSKFEELQAFLYSAQSHEDALLLKWWLELNETNDLTNLLFDDVHRLQPFLSLFTPPTHLLYATNGNSEIDNAAWFVPANLMYPTETAYGAMWCNTQTRGKHRQLAFADLAYSLAFEVFDAIVGTTWQEKQLPVHRKLGYNIVGSIPNIHGKERIYIVHLTREDFMASKLHHAAIRLEGRK
jgi:hypothetical protein